MSCTFAQLKTACYHASPLCKGVLTARQGRDCHMWDAEERPPARKAPVPHLILSPSSLSPLLSHFYSEHVKSRNQPNSMKTNAGPDFYLEHLDTLPRSKDRPRFTRTLSNASHRAFHSSSRAERGICCLRSECRITRGENARNKLFREGTASTPPTSSRTPSARSAFLSADFPPSLPAIPPSDFSISNRQWLARLENAATHTKQSSGELSNRHIWGPISPDSRVEFMAHP